MATSKRLVLLGAGASVPADLPTATKMTTLMASDDGELTDELGDTTREIIRFAAGGIQMRRGVQGENPLHEVNIEEVITAVEMLANREELEISPFVSQWHRAVPKMGEARKQDGHSRLDRRIRDVMQEATSSDDNPRRRTRDASRRLAEALQYYFGEFQSPFHDNVFDLALEQVTTLLIDLLLLEDAARTTYLDPLVRKADEQQVTIATLNYDNTIELAAERLGLSLEVGLREWNEYGRLPNPDSGIELLKLHGSIDWVRNEERASGESLFPTVEIGRRNTGESAVDKRSPAIIFGTRNKLTEEGPFLDLFQTFKKRLDDCSELVVIGYSFGDAHVNHVIQNWMNQDTKRRIIVVDRPGIDEENHPFWQQNRRLQSTDRVQLRAIGTEQGISDLFAN